MAQTKQTQRKQPNKQGHQPSSPRRGSQPARQPDTYRLPVTTITILCRIPFELADVARVYGGKARVYKRPAGLKRKYRPGVGALHEIRHYQREHGTICSKIACARLFRELCEKEKTGLRWQASAIMALQEGFEDYLVELFRDMVLAAIHGRRKTVMPKDIHLVRQLRQETDPYAGSVSLRDLKKKNKKGEQDFDEYGNVLY